RPQGDLDLYCRKEQTSAARGVLAQLGYAPLPGLEDVPTDHAPPMIRQSSWTWRGDYFDPDAPIAVELHYRFWDEETERIRLDGLDAFWNRRQDESIGDFHFPALAPVDRVGYAALHFVRHLLRGDFRLFHAYELAHFLESTHADREFWQSWQDLHSSSLRSLEAIAFRFASDWFGCRVPSQVASEWDQFPDAPRRWFDDFSQAPLAAKQRPNKNELWLHLSLLQSPRDRRAVAVRRLLPLRRQKTQYAAHVPPELVTWRLRVERKMFQARYAMKRLSHHVRSTLPTLASGARFWFNVKGLNSQLFAFLFATSLFNVGMGIYFLLHNLFLLDQGFREDSLGAVSSALGVGSLTGTMPAAFGLHRYGVRKLLILTFAGVPLVSALRIIWNTPEVLIGSGFAAGFLMSLYAVSLAPTIAQWTTESARPFAFSLVFSLGIGTGILSSLVGGHLPAILSLRNALLLSCLIASLGSLVAWKLKFDKPARKEDRIYPRSRFMRRFLIAIFLWSLATGAFNPFFSAYFSQALHFRVNQIGFVAAAGQCVQVAAILCAPLLLSRFGVITGVMSMQLATAIALALLSLGSPGWISGGLYALYMGFQYMSEPGMYSLLMDEVAPHERGGAAALNFFVISGTQAVAAMASGLLIKSVGYVPVIMFAALLAALAAIAFRGLLKNVPESPRPLACDVRQ
ncbi:MAG TPA: MFS transporter, partial [Bryobacteraceae bacterium]|nr:MFS transporter [Bryobacteraceae bacterium]